MKGKKSLEQLSDEGPTKNKVGNYETSPSVDNMKYSTINTTLAISLATLTPTSAEYSLWPGLSTTKPKDTKDYFGENLSGLYYQASNPTTNSNIPTIYGEFLFIFFG